MLNKYNEIKEASNKKFEISNYAKKYYIFFYSKKREQVSFMGLITCSLSFHATQLFPNFSK